MEELPKPDSNSAMIVEPDTPVAVVVPDRSKEPYRLRIGCPPSGTTLMGDLRDLHLAIIEADRLLSQEVVRAAAS